MQPSHDSFYFQVCTLTFGVSFQWREAKKYSKTELSLSAGCHVSITHTLCKSLPAGLDVSTGAGWECGSVMTRLKACSLCLTQVGFHLRERLPVHGHSSQLRLHQNERCGLHQREWKRESLGCGRLRLPSSGR